MMSIGDRIRTHGKSQTAIYKRYRSMLNRCAREAERSYHSYGGRGIAVCRRWRGKNGFVNFLADMGEPPAGHTLDRKNGDGSYSPGNCRWTTKTGQAHNRRDNVLATKDGRTQLLMVWAKELGCSYGTLHSRVRRGLTPDQAVAVPIRLYRIRR